MKNFVAVLRRGSQIGRKELHDYFIGTVSCMSSDCSRMSTFDEGTVVGGGQLFLGVGTLPLASLPILASDFLGLSGSP